MRTERDVTDQDTAELNGSSSLFWTVASHLQPPPCPPLSVSPAAAASWEVLARGRSPSVGLPPTNLSSKTLDSNFFSAAPGASVAVDQKRSGTSAALSAGPEETCFNQPPLITVHALSHDISFERNRRFALWVRGLFSMC